MGNPPQSNHISNQTELENSFESYDGEDDTGDVSGVQAQSIVDSYKQYLQNQHSEGDSPTDGSRGDGTLRTRNTAYEVQEDYETEQVSNHPTNEGGTYDYCYYETQEFEDTQA